MNVNLGNNPAADPVQQMIRRKLEELQKKIIDFSARNPLIKTNLSGRGDLVQVIDELPDILAFKLRDQKKLSFSPLPPLDSEPADEQTGQFQKLLKNRMAEDDEYLAALSSGGEDEDSGSEESAILQIAERKLRDQLRRELKMPPRPPKGQENLEEHARRQGLNPDYELPRPEGIRAAKHEDSKIQTLMLPKDLERRFNTILAKCQSTEEETGINTMHAAFGFLKGEFKADSAKKEFYAPLILLPVRVSRSKTPKGFKFSVLADGE
ncbi:MAG: DUF4011 domain-containing protein, partial [Deltaproteobacteria bacterium]|nr:DUF4011 domain-containing protein [Deltaproteobacteria bacterium]